jgi:hypothetical protein
MLLAEVVNLAKVYDAIPAWMTVAIRPKDGTYSAYFGLVAKLGNRRSRIRLRKSLHWRLKRAPPAMAAGITKRHWEMTDIVDLIDAWEAKQVRQTRLAA